jgi:hypothetical protein
MPALAFNNINDLWRDGTFRVDGKGCLHPYAGTHRAADTTLDETFDNGSDTGRPVDDRGYQVQFTSGREPINLRAVQMLASAMPR